MEDYLTRKYYRVHNEYMNALICIENTLDLGWYYMCRRLIKPTTGLGYFSDTDILNLGYNDLVEIDPIIWSKIYKILKMNAIACNTIIQNCKECDSPTSCYITTLPIKTHYKLFEVLKDYQILTRFSNSQAWIREIKDDAVKFETMFSTNRRWISPEIYSRVKNNVEDTIEEIDDIWKTI